jgi:DNA-binding PadR family transcriptional regulator
MLAHLILGLLRNGEPQHGYQLVVQHRALTGQPISPGNVYRELARLASDGFVRVAIDRGNVGDRRIPYQITSLGRQHFDEWLLSPAKQAEELGEWLLFLDCVPVGIRDRVLSRIRDTLWSESKRLEQAREDALAKHPLVPGRYHPLPALLSRRLNHVTAELEFLNELCLELGTEGGHQALAADMPSVVEHDEPASLRTPKQSKQPRGT